MSDVEEKVTKVRLDLDVTLAAVWEIADAMRKHRVRRLRIEEIEIELAEPQPK